MTGEEREAPSLRDAIVDRLVVHMEETWTGDEEADFRAVWTTRIGDVLATSAHDAGPEPTVLALLSAPQWRDQSRLIEFTDHDGQRCQLRARATGADRIFPDSPVAPWDYERWRVTTSDLDARARLAPNHDASKDVTP